MKTQIQNLCTFTVGLPNSKFDKGSSLEETSTFLVLGAAIGTLGQVLTAELQPVIEKPDQNYTKHYLQVGDVLILSRGSSIRAALVTEELASSRLLANATITVIRPDSTKLLGELLVTFFNSELGQATLTSLQQGASIPSLPLKELKQLEISVPDLSNQEKIQELFHANITAYQDTIALAEQQKKTATTVMLQMMQGA
jgi:restriction endonuclease S subunit